MLDVVCYDLNHLNFFYNASVLRHKKRKCISSLQKYHDPSCPLNNCKDVKALLLAFNNELRNSFFVDVHEILWSAFEYIETDSYFKLSSRNYP